MAEIKEYVRVNGGRGAAASVVEAIHACFERIAGTDGTIGHPRDELRDGLRSFPVKSWVLYFTYRADDEVVLLRVLHGRRDVETEFRPRKRWRR